jgi:hypothetical protein
MTVAQIRQMGELTAELGDAKKVNFSQWTHGKFITINFMKLNGEFWRYDINPDGTYEGEESV